MTYSLTDGNGDETSTLTLSVTSVDDPISDGDETASTLEDAAKSGNVIDVASTGDGDVTLTSFSVAGDETTYTAGQTATITNVGTLTLVSYTHLTLPTVSYP